MCFRPASVGNEPLKCPMCGGAVVATMDKCPHCGAVASNAPAKPAAPGAPKAPGSIPGAPKAPGKIPGAPGKA